ncbi:Flp pilus assembly complex ATPase component TadA [Lactobacillus sp. LC28-10]|uniref:Flp pilus assembly complex ATPase component TadA n=1 Tax=Secundilactobacillus angelensis TaxID=2722706 RepID=A0ABX1KWA1_9LACO|nr:competence type IV pilus ATPase ComGA [Secundilactobacillus angelensis]MCH5462600.1 Flp pilus assembly complex ATPase component TadA [Secundilactobacillus angelensis]NLR18209.1 Flp pilus assembly complex ATPase component TadA [Secundilactobacillus angelensis]
MIEELGETLLSAAMASGSSDLHIQPVGDNYKVFEHHGDGLSVVKKLSMSEGQQLIAHFKYRANMAITETRRPQLGALTLEVDGQLIHLRLSSVGNFINQESIVIRLLLPLKEQRLAFLVSSQLIQLRQWCDQRGLVLFAGPTGSGKTSTIYHLAKELSRTLSVLAIEDPTEIVAPDFLQLQVNPAAEMSYQALIKVALRHRPEVLIVGEIRDRETAKAAVDAALSGHLVLSSVHAQTAKGTVTRLNQLGIDSAALNQAVTGVAYQRLLPTANGDLAALLDLADGPVENWQHTLGMTPQWEENLADARRNGQITAKVCQRFKAG